MRIWGINPVREFLARRPDLVEVVELAGVNPRLAAIRTLAQGVGVAVREGADPREWEPGHQGVAALVTVPPSLALEDLLSPAGSSLLLLALDSVQDPHNLGAILRVAAATGVHAVILPKDRAAPLSGTAVKVSAGGAAIVPTCRVTNLAVALQRLKEAGVWVYGTAGTGGEIYHRISWPAKLCLVMGSEERGLRPLVARQCDGLVTVPMANQVESLNVAVAGAVILFDVQRQREGDTETEKGQTVAPPATGIARSESADSTGR